jgi:hypothetical protein
MYLLTNLKTIIPRIHNNIKGIKGNIKLYNILPMNVVKGEYNIIVLVVVMYHHIVV